MIECEAEHFLKMLWGFPRTQRHLLLTLENNKHNVSDHAYASMT